MAMIDRSTGPSVEPLQNVLDRLPNIRVFWKDTELRYVGCNAAFARDAGMERPADLIGKTDFEMGWREQADLYRNDDFKVMRELNSKLNFEEPQTAPNGSKSWLKTSKIVLRNEAGETQGILGVYEDITAQKMLELEKKEIEGMLVESSRLAALGEMTGTIAHEINTPLAIILGKTRQLLRALDQGSISPEKVKESLSIIENTCNKISHIVTGLKNLTRDGSTDGFEVKPLLTTFRDVRSVSTESAQRKNVKITWPEEALAAATLQSMRQVQIGQVLLNLISNAIDALKHQDEPWITISLLDSERCLDIRVTDSGTGIPLENQEKIFHPFFTTKQAEHGTGLGLSISKRIMEQHNGDLLLDTSGDRTRFIMRFYKKPTARVGDAS